MLDKPAPNTRNVRWNGQTAQLITGDFGTVCERLPIFERQPIRWDAQNRPDAELILRLSEANNAPAVPVAMVTDSYELIQHTEIAEALGTALESLYLEPYKLPAWLTITEYGERIHLVVMLPSKEFKMGDGFTVQLTAHCFNSVDKSMALQLRLGWYRWVCSNGLFIGAEAAHTRQVHAAGLHPIDLPKVLQDQLASAEDERARLQKWETATVTVEQVTKWIDETVAKQWGVTVAARAYHAACEGRDGIIEIKPATKCCPTPARLPISVTSQVRQFLCATLIK